MVPRSVLLDRGVITVGRGDYEDHENDEANHRARNCKPNRSRLHFLRAISHSLGAQTHRGIPVHLR